MNRQQRGTAALRDFAPRSLLRREKISVQLTPHELCLLIEGLELRARAAAEDEQQVDYADFLFRRCAELREAGR
jgi:hypothetical protein